MKLYDLDALIKAVCPIDGIDSNGGICFQAQATQAQKDAAIALMSENIANVVVAKFL